MRTHKHLRSKKDCNNVSRRKVVLAGLTGAVTLKAFDLDDKTLTTRTSSTLHYIESKRLNQNITKVSFRGGRVI